MIVAVLLQATCMTRACHVQRRRRLRLSASAGFRPDRGHELEFGKWVLLAIGLGSQRESPFLHMTRDIGSAVKWLRMGQRDRRETESYLIRVPRWTLEERLVDMSTHDRQVPQQQRQRWQCQRDRLSACQ